MTTIQLPPDFKEFLQLLNIHSVEYLLIGGYAVGYYGYPRATGDMDIWVAFSPDNIRAVAASQAEQAIQRSSQRPQRFAKSSLTIN